MVQIGEKTWSPVGGAFFYICTCEHSRSHIFGPIFMKFGQHIFFLDTRVEFKNNSGQLNNMVAGRGQFFHYAPPL